MGWGGIKEEHGGKGRRIEEPSPSWCKEFSLPVKSHSVNDGMDISILEPACPINFHHSPPVYIDALEVNFHICVIEIYIETRSTDIPFDKGIN